MGRVLHDGHRGDDGRATDEVHDRARGQAFTVVLLLGGVGAALYTFTLLATVVVEGGLPEAAAAAAARTYARNHQGSLHHLRLRPHRQHRRAASSGARTIPYVVVERNAERLQAAIEDGALGVEADASREDVLKRVGIERARGLIAAVGTDAENVYAVLSARVLRPDLFIVGRAETEDATIKLKRAGADRVISPYQIGAVQIAQTALRPAVVDFMELATSSDNLELAMEQITIAPQLGAGEPVDSRREPAAAIRRDRGRHSAGGQPDGVQPGAGHADPAGRQAGRARPAGSLKRLDATRPR